VTVACRVKGSKPECKNAYMSFMDPGSLKECVCYQDFFSRANLAQALQISFFHCLRCFSKREF
jgi:hypothetical protein